MYESSVQTRPCRSALMGAVLFYRSASAYGQADQGRIGGVVKDTTGGVIPGVTVVVKNDRTGQEHSALSGETGEYLITALRPSTYTVKANLAGFSTVERTGIELVVGQKSTLDITLQPGGVTSQVD